MDTRIKNYLGIIAIVAIASAVLALIMFVNAYTRSAEPTNFRSFSVSGDGKAVAIPDVAMFTFQVITQGKDIAAIEKTSTDKVNEAIAYLKSQGIDAKDIQTQSYDLQPQYQYFSCPMPLGGAARSCPPPQISGYVVTQSAQVKVRDLAKTGTVMAGVVDKGANSTQGPNFTIDDPSQVQNQARAQAIEKAKAKAQALAQAGGFGLGRLLGIDESTSNPIYPRPMMYGAGAGVSDMKASAPQIEPGSQEVNVTVTLKYEIQ